MAKLSWRRTCLKSEELHGSFLAADPYGAANLGFRVCFSFQTAISVSAPS